MKDKMIWLTSLILSAALVFAANSFTPYFASMLYYLFLCLVVYLLAEIIYSEATKLTQKFSYKPIPVENQNKM